MFTALLLLTLFLEDTNLGDTTEVGGGKGLRGLNPGAVFRFLGLGNPVMLRFRFRFDAVELAMLAVSNAELHSELESLCISSLISILGAFALDVLSFFVTFFEFDFLLFVSIRLKMVDWGSVL